MISPDRLLLMPSQLALQTINKAKKSLHKICAGLKKIKLLI
jgi:hypothetical protein